MPLCQWAEEDWNVLLYAIRKGKCILMLGPETALAHLDGHPTLLSRALAYQLTRDMEPRYKENIEPSNLMEAAQYYCLQPGRGKIDLQLKIRDFYTQHRSALSGSFHRDLAALPFYLAILSTPDELFETALKEQHKNPTANIILNVEIHFQPWVTSQAPGNIRAGVGIERQEQWSGIPRGVDAVFYQQRRLCIGRGYPGCGG